MKPIEQIAKEMFLLESFEDYDIKTLVAILSAADEHYFNQDQTFLADAEYDVLKRYVKQLEPQHSYFIGVGAEIRGGKVRLPYPMGSLDQVYEGEICDWVGKYDLQNEHVIVANKLDGVSAMLVYNDAGNLKIAYSRGNGLEGADITRHVKQISSVPKTNVTPNLVVRGEIIFPIHKFKQIKHRVKSRSGDVYKNPRNAISGMMNAESNDPSVYPAIDFIAHGIVNSNLDKTTQLDSLLDNRFNVVVISLWEGRQLTDQTLTDYLNTNRKISEYEIDGLVIDVDSAFKRKQMTPTRETLNPGYAIKYKVADESNLAIAKVVNVEWNVSKHGYLKPRVEIEPVQLAGVTVRYATGFNAKFVSDNMIGPGAVVQITRSGEVIPFLQKVLQHAEKAAMPSVDWTWNETDVDAILLNPSEHAEVMIQQTLEFFRTLNAPQLKEGTVRTMFEFNNYADAKGAITSMLNYDTTYWNNCIGVNGDKIYQGLSKLLTDIPLFILMGASPFFGRGLGTRKFKQLLKHIQIREVEDLLTLTMDDIVAVEGFDEKTARKVLAGVDEFISFYNAIVRMSVEFNSVNTGGAMIGQIVVFTGYRNKQLEALIESEGGKVGTGVSSKTTLVTAASPDSNSGKVKKAKELGIQILSEKELKLTLGV